MIDISALTELISAFRVETEKESISPETVGSILQDIVDLLSTATSQTEYNVLNNWKETLSQYRFLYDIQERNVSDHSNVILQLLGRTMANGSTYSLTLPITPATKDKAGVLTAEDYTLLHVIESTVEELTDSLLETQETVEGHSAKIAGILAAGYVLQFFSYAGDNASKVSFNASRYSLSAGGSVMSVNALTIEAATTTRAGVMTAQQVLQLNNAKTDITTLKSAMTIVKGGGALVDGIRQILASADQLVFQVLGYNVATGEQDVELQQITLSGATTGTAGLMTAKQVKQLAELRAAVFGGDGITNISRQLGIRISHGKDAIFLTGYEELVSQGYTPYLFRYSKKRNRITDEEGNKSHGDLRKGWNVLGKVGTVSIGPLGEIRILKDALKHPDINIGSLETYQTKAMFFVKDELNSELKKRFASYGKIKIPLTGTSGYRKIRLQYGIAFASVQLANHQLLDASMLVTPIVPFHVSTDVGNSGRTYSWIFER